MAATVALGAKLGCNRPVVTLDRRLQVPFLENNVCPTGNSPDNAFFPEGDHDTPNLAPMAATLRAPVRAALASSSRARIVTRHSSRCPRAVSGSSAGGAPSNVEVITFDLDDTLWPTTPVVMAANKAFVDFCQERIPGFPDCAGINEYMKVSLISPKDTVSRRTPSSHTRRVITHRMYHPSITRPHDTQAIRTEREARSKKLGERHVPLSFAALRIAAGFRAACELGVPEPDAVGIASRGTFFLIYTRAIRLTACCV